MKNITLTEVLLILIGLTSLLGQWQRLSTPFGLISLHEILLLALVVFSLYRHRSAWLDILKQPVIWLGIAWVGWLLLITIINSQITDNFQLLQVGLAYWLRLVLYALGWFALAAYLKINPERRRIVLNGLMAWLAVQLLFGLGQYLLLPDTRQLVYLGWDDHLSRAMGTLLDPGFFGLLMVFGAVLSFDRYLESDKLQKLIFSWWPILFAGFVLGLALSFSRASYIAYISAFLIYAFLKRQRIIWLTLPLLIMAILLIPKDGGGEGQKLLRTNSIEARTEVLSYHTQDFSGLNWLIGRGWYYEGSLQLHRQALSEEKTEFTATSHARAVDNTYLHILFSAGIPGLFLFGLILMTLAWKLRLAPTTEAILGAVIIHSLFSTALLYPWVWLIGGGVVVLSLTQLDQK
jgi:hypothetical protein